MAARLFVALALGSLVAVLATSVGSAQSDPSADQAPADEVTVGTDDQPQTTPEVGPAPDTIQLSPLELQRMLDAERAAVVDLVRSVPSPFGGAFSAAITPSVTPPGVASIAAARLTLDWRSPLNDQWISLPDAARQAYADRVAAAVQQGFPDRAVMIQVVAVNSSLRPVLTTARR